MCGIAGWVRNTNVEIDDKYINKLKAATYALVKQIEVRGKDSTGFALQREGDNQVIKVRRCLKASEFLKRRVFTSRVLPFIQDSTRILMAHTRAATHGPVRRINTHPINIKNLWLTHNGIITNWDNLQHKFDLYESLRTKDGSYHGTDTSRLAAHLATKLPDKLDGSELQSMAEAIEDGVGSAALAMMVEQQPYLYLFRDTSPLSFFYDREGHTLFWSSLRSASFKLKSIGFDVEDRVGSLKPGILVRFNPTLFDDEHARYDYHTECNLGYMHHPHNYEDSWFYSNNRKKTKKSSKESDRDTKQQIIYKPSTGTSKGTSTGPNSAGNVSCGACCCSVSGKDHWRFVDKLADNEKLCQECYTWLGEFLVKKAGHNLVRVWAGYNE